MKQYPKNLKYKKYQKINNFYIKTLEKKNFIINKGNIALKSINSGKINFKQIESCRRTIKRGLKKIGIFWIQIFTNIPIFKKSLASRMGKGKGNLFQWVAVIKKGTILFEINNINFLKAKFILTKSKTKLPLKTIIVKNIF